MGDERTADDGGLTETRWRKYGKDRVYLRTAEGETVGYVDMVARTAVITNEAHAASVEAARERWLSHEPGAVQQVAAPPAEIPVSGWAPPTEPPTEGMEPPRAIDLATNVAGAAAQARRDEVNAQAPVRNLVARVLGVKTDERAWRVGAKGEQKVGKELASLGPAWRILHAVPVGERGSDIDHVVIGPAGVYTINAKCHPDGKAWVAERAILVNGQRTDYLRNARFEGKRAAALLTAAVGRPVDVEPMVVFVDLADITIKQQPDGVHVTTRRRLVRWFAARPAVLSADAIDEIYGAARRATSWRR